MSEYRYPSLPLNPHPFTTPLSLDRKGLDLGRLTSGSSTSRVGKGPYQTGFITTGRVGSKNSPDRNVLLLLLIKSPFLPKGKGIKCTGLYKKNVSSFGMKRAEFRVCLASLFSKWFLLDLRSSLLLPLPPIQDSQ